MGALGLVLSVFLPETFAPVILMHKATRLREETGTWTLHAKQEEASIDTKQIMTKYFARPMIMLVTEPLLLAVSFYQAFIYAILYLFFTAYPIVFQEVYDFNPGEAGLPWFAITIGVIAACAVTMASTPIMNRRTERNHGTFIPEWRLPQVIVGGVAFAAGLFWFVNESYGNQVKHALTLCNSGLAGLASLKAFTGLCPPCPVY